LIPPNATLVDDRLAGDVRGPHPPGKEPSPPGSQPPPFEDWQSLAASTGNNQQQEINARLNRKGGLSGSMV
jgi:hypothetical protein